MRLFKQPTPTNMDLNLAPMVDVMMCLIIFFLLASQIVARESVAEITLPEADAADFVEREEIGTRITINVLDAGDDAPARYIVAAWDGSQVAQVERTLEELQAFIAVRQRVADQRNEQLRCVIRGDAEVDFGEIKALMRAAAEADVKNLVFSVRQHDAGAAS